MEEKRWEPINFVFYASFVKWPVLVGFIMEIIFRLMAGNWLEDWSIGQLDLIAWFIRLAVFGYVGFRIVKVYGEVPPMGGLAGIITGVELGFLMAIFRLYEGVKFWKFFNLLTEPVLTALVGGLTVFLVVYLWELLPEKKNNKNN